MNTITPCLWFDTEAHDAAEFYTSVFPNSKISDVAHYPDGSVLTVSFELDGKPFTALNGGPQFTFTEAVSMQIPCRDQDEVDRYWAALTDGGAGGSCGWLTDRFGFSWQIVPVRVPELLQHPDREVANRVFDALMGMKKIDVAALEEAALAPA